MKRDWDAIRRILVEIEALPTGHSLGSKDLKEMDAEVVGFSMGLLIEAGLVKGTCLDMGGTLIYHAQRLTWQGYELLDGIRKDAVWETIKESVGKKGADQTLDTLVSVA